jgi:uncharacterized sulfatase
MNALIILSLLALTPSATPPNIVWIVGEDMGPELGCYSDPQAITPHIDRLAQQGVRYEHAFTHAPVCAPSRSGLVTGQYPTTIGSHHMRSTLLKPPPMFTEYLRKAGYTICWPTKAAYGKTDFNFQLPKQAFDVQTDWTKAIPKTPFFGFYNITTSHESQIRANPQQLARNLAPLKPNEFHDPRKMRLPAYSPDTPEARRDLANYYDLVTSVDHQVGKVLDAIDKAGIADNTVVILTGDHGRGLPRSKRWVYHQGIHVPLIIRWPKVIKPGSVNSELACFLDFAPTTLAITGADIPKAMVGRVLVGPSQQPAPKYVYASRDRMDETYDRIRSVHDGRFQYIRNYHPELPYAQRISYMEEMPTMQVWRRLNNEGQLDASQSLFFAATKPKEELYDVEADPDEVHNLALDPKYSAKLVELRSAHERWVIDTKDLGSVSEQDLIKRGLVADRLKEYDARKEPPTK